MQDQDSTNRATDNDDPLRFTGPSGLDRKQQYSFSGIFDLPFYLKLSVIGHFFSPLPQSLLLPELTNGGEIFATDWLGSGLGSAGGPGAVAGNQMGQYDHRGQIADLDWVRRVLLSRCQELRSVSMTTASISGICKRQSTLTTTPSPLRLLLREIAWWPITLLVPG